MFRDDDEIKYCVECGEEMQLREGQYGMYWGCTAWPECKHSEKATEEDIEGFDDNDVDYND